MESDKIKFWSFYNQTKKSAIKEIKTCYYPGCDLKSINSHILQKNGILSNIAFENHLWEHVINQFKEQGFQFKKTGINQVYSFNCFCQKHDSELFKEIETSEINFENYRSCLLFSVRTLYNEIFRKEVNIQVYNQLLSSSYCTKINQEFIELCLEQEKLGLNDLISNEKDIWNDLNNGTHSFVFKFRELQQIEICLSAFYNHETTIEMNLYRFKYGKDMERISEISINLFPYRNKSILIMGYNKKDAKSVKAEFNKFFTESEKRLQRKLTNLFLFACETWVISEKFYFNKIKDIEELIGFASNYSTNNLNERQNFALNMFGQNFKIEMIKWKKKIEKK